MKIELEKTDLIDLIRGTYPNYEQMQSMMDMGLGTYTGGFVDRWDWNRCSSTCWSKLSEEELFELYKRLR